MLLYWAGHIRWYGTTSVPPPYSCFVIGVGGVRVPGKVGCPRVIGVSELEWIIITNPLLANKKSAKDLIRTVALCETWNVQQKPSSDCGLISLYAEQWVWLGTGDCCLSLPCVNQERPWLTHRFWSHIQLVHFWFFNNLNHKRSSVLCCLENRFSKLNLRAVCVVGRTLTRLQRW